MIYHLTNENKLHNRRISVQVSVFVMTMEREKIKNAIIYLCHGILTKKKVSATLLPIVKRDAQQVTSWK